MTKLPQDLRFRVARETDKEVWEIDGLMSLLRKEIEAREAMEMIKLHQVKNPISSSFRSPAQTPLTAAALVGNGLPVRCVYIAMKPTILLLAPSFEHLWNAKEY